MGSAPSLDLMATEPVMVSEPVTDPQPEPAVISESKPASSDAEKKDPASPVKNYGEVNGTEKTLSRKMSNEDLYEGPTVQSPAAQPAAQSDSVMETSTTAGQVPDTPCEEDTNTSQRVATDDTVAANDASLAPISTGNSSQSTIVAESESDVKPEEKFEDAVENVDTLTSKKTTEATDATVELSQASATTSSIPPHPLPTPRTGVEPLNGLHNSRHSDQSPVSPRHNRSQHFDPTRAPRYNQPQFQHNYQRNAGMDPEQAARLHAEVLSLKRVLEVERKANVNMRKTIETEQQRKSDAAFATMLGSLMREQEAAHVMKATAEAKMRDLEHCTKKIEQMEVFLAEGQKQLYHQLDHEGIRYMSAVEREKLRREAELAIETRLADAFGDLQARSERVGLREAAQDMREQQYKKSIRATLEREIRSTMKPEEDIEEIAELEYNRAYAVGKEAAKKFVDKAVAKAAAPVMGRKDSFIEGYAAYHRAQTALDNLRHGRITQDSPELAFLFDAGHADNFIVRGMQMGQLRMGTTTPPLSKDHGEASRPTLNGATPPAPPNLHSTIPNGATSAAPLNIHGAVVVTATPPTPPSSAERVRKMPPPRPTLAAELRGATPMHNGAYILANGSAASATTTAPVVKTGCFADVGINLLDL